MSQMFDLTLPTASTPELTQNMPAPHVPSCIINLSHANATIIHLQTSCGANLKGDTTKGTWKETKEKLDSLGKQIRQVKGSEAMESVNFFNPCIYLNLKLSPNFKMPDFQKYDGTVVLCPTSVSIGWP